MRTLKLSKDLAFAIRFIRFVEDTKTDPSIAAQLVMRARKVFRTAERETSDSTYPAAAKAHADLARCQLEKQATAANYEVIYPGLWPELRDNETNPPRIISFPE